VGESHGLRLEGGFDRGAVRRGRVVYRRGGPWTPAVRHLLSYLADQGFRGAPRPVPSNSEDGDVVTYLDGEKVGAQRPCPAWMHTGEALGQVGRWLRDYQQAVADYRPPPHAVWQESHVPYGPGVVIAHNDAAPYNAVWKDGKLVGFIDWDMAGPRWREDDLPGLRSPGCHCTRGTLWRPKGSPTSAGAMPGSAPCSTATAHCSLPMR
jgi:hypothetical protein